MKLFAVLCILNGQSHFPIICLKYSVQGTVYCFVAKELEFGPPGHLNVSILLLVFAFAAYMPSIGTVCSLEMQPVVTVLICYYFAFVYPAA